RRLPPLPWQPEDIRGSLPHFVATGSHRTHRNLPALTCLSQGFFIRHDKIDKEDSMAEQETELAQAVPSLIDQAKELIDEGQLVLDRLQNLIERCKALRTAIL